MKVGRKATTKSEAVKYLKTHKLPFFLVEWGGGSYPHSRFKCKKCGHVWDQRFSNIKRGRGCPECYRRKCEEDHNAKIVEIRNWLSQHKPHLTLIEYSRSNSLALFCCSCCGMFFGQRAYLVRRGVDCPYCNGQIKNEVAASKWLSENNPKIKLVRWGGGCHKYSIYECGVCGNIWSARFSAIKYTVHAPHSYSCGCPKCHSSWKGIKNV